MNVERDRLQVQLNKSQEQAKQFAAESNNLHLVLEQFTQGSAPLPPPSQCLLSGPSARFILFLFAEKEQQQAAEVEFYLRETSNLKQEKQALLHQLAQLKVSAHVEKLATAR